MRLPQSWHLLSALQHGIQQQEKVNTLFHSVVFLFFHVDLKLPTEFVQRLIEMGFSRQLCEKCVEATKTTSIEEAVAWMFANKPVCHKINDFGGENINVLI